MLIRKIKIKDSLEIGDVELDFCDENANPYRTIIIAGGNGTGKTLILERIYGIISGEKIEEFSGEFTIEFELEKIDKNLTRELMGEAAKERGFSRNILSDQYKYRLISNKENGSCLVLLQHDQEKQIFTNRYRYSDGFCKLIKCFYSAAAVHIEKYIPSSVSGQKIDDIKIQSKRTDLSLSQDITQLFTDIRTADNEDLAKYREDHPGEVIPEAIGNKRMQPFLKAIQYMFPNKKFKTVKQDNGFIIEFEEFGRKSTINDLSSGEKQIIFRGGFFLKNLSIIEGGIVLIDEPELSLHPEWQSRIVGFYHHLFSSLRACPQIILVTHSPFVIHGALGAKTIVLHKNSENGQAVPMDKPTYPTVGRDAALFAFNIDDFLARHNEKPMVLLVEGQTDKVILTEAWSKLRPNSPMNFEIRNALGMKNIAITLNNASTLFSIGDKKIVGLFDFDDAFNQWNGVFGKQPLSGNESSGLMKKHKSGSLYAMLLPVPKFRNRFASSAIAGESMLCIEFLFPDNLIDDITQKKLLPCDQLKMTIKNSKKTEFAEKVKTFPKEAFSAFEPLFQNLEKIYKNEL